MIYEDFTGVAAAAISALGLVSKALPECSPCERNVVYADNRVSVHVVGPLLVLVNRSAETRALIQPLDFVHLHLAQVRGATDKAERNILDALVSLFSPRSRHGQQLRDKVWSAFNAR